MGLETPTKVPGRRGIRNTTGAEGIEEHFVLAAQFQVLHAGTAAQGVEGQIENVIGLVIGEMDFQKVQAFVNSLAEADTASQQHHGTDATMGNTTNATGKLVIDVPRGKHGPFTTGEDGLVQPPLDAPFALSQLLPLDPPLAKRPL